MKRKSVDEEAINFFQAIFYIQLSKSTPFKFDTTEIQTTKRLSKEAIDQRMKEAPSDFVGSFLLYWELINEKLQKIW